MTPHCKVYFKHFKLTEADFIPCEVCSDKSVDLHHIQGRGKGKDVIENIMALCRDCHHRAHFGTKVLTKTVLQTIHNNFLNK